MFVVENKNKWIFETDQGLLLNIFVSPRSSKNQIVGMYDGRLKIMIKSPPVDGKANELLIKYVADVFSTPKQSVSIKKGISSKRKQLLVKGITREELIIVLKKKGVFT